MARKDKTAVTTGWRPDPPQPAAEEPAKRSRRSRKRRGATSEAPVSPVVGAMGESTMLGSDTEVTAEADIPAPWQPRRSKFAARWGYYSPTKGGIPTTTRQAEVTCTALSAPPSLAQGIALGQELITGMAINHDPFTSYNAVPRIVSSPNVAIVGDLGLGKSTCAKCAYVLRPLIFDRRRVVVMDKKDQGGAGEYTELTERYGSHPIRLQQGGGGSRINIFDPGIGVGEVLPGPGSIMAQPGQLERKSDRLAGQASLWRAMATKAMNGRVPDEWESKALRLAHRGALQQAEDLGRAPVLPDAVALLSQPPQEALDWLVTTAARDRFYEAGLTMAFALERLMDDDCAGLFDGETTPDVRLDSKLTTFDISQLPNDGPATALAMIVCNTWLTNTLRRDRGWWTNFIAEEGWHLVSDDLIAEIFQHNSKLSRGLGLSNIAAIHHISDIPAESPAIAMLKESETIHIFGQRGYEDAKAAQQLWNLPETMIEEIMDLPVGRHFLKVGTGAPQLVSFHRSELEAAITGTDSAMGGDAA